MQLIRRGLSYYRHEWQIITIVLALMIVITGFEMLLAWPMATMVDSVLTSTPKSSGFSSVLLSWLPRGQLGQIIGLTLVAVLLQIFKDLLEGVRTMVNAVVNYRGLARVRAQLFRKLQALDLAFHRTHPQGDTIYRMTVDTAKGPQEILQITVESAMAFLKLFALLTVMLLQSVPLTLAALLLVAPLMLASTYFGRKLKARHQEVKASEAGFMTTVQHGVSAMSLTQAYAREGREFARFEGSFAALVRSWFRFHWVDVAYNITLGAMLAMGAAVVFGYGGFLVWRDQFWHPVNNGMSLGMLMAFGFYLAMMRAPLTKLTSAPAVLQNALVSMRRIADVLDREPAVQDPPAGVALPVRPRTLTLRDVHVRFGDTASVIHGASATVMPGQMVAFVGKSGAGKSTILGLLPRFYDPAAGTVALDGVDLRTARLPDVRRHFALVPQDVATIPASIEENIRYGRAEATADDIVAAARLAGAHDFIAALPDGYATVIAEAGANLSGGQRQRIAIARALLSEAPVLVLDEPTSSLDPAHESLIVDTIESLKRDRTIVLVTHRLNTVVNCDQIYVLDAGRIVEHGTHEALLARKGLYADMLRQQREADRLRMNLVA